jgi:hypothetical protein
VTSDAGLLLPRELDERLGLTALIERHLTDPRTGRNRQFPLADPSGGRKAPVGGLPVRCDEAGRGGVVYIGNSGGIVSISDGR